MKTTKNLVFVIICMFMFSCLYSCGWGSKKVEPTTQNTENTKDKTDQSSVTDKSLMDANVQQNQQTQVPVTGNAGGNTSVSTAGGILEEKSTPFIFRNGKKGFNYCFTEGQELPTLTGDFGVTKDGIYFVSENLYNRRRPAGATKLKVEGVATSNDVRWEYKDCVLKDGYYQYDGDLVYQDDGDNIFCFAYFNSKDECLEEYLPHRSVKGGIAYTDQIR